ncbi:MAG TPA: FAD-dependent oxidoreductase [Gaiellaceae bacterium]|nr:FAD-dependent oxidoreductase [Gaiellaceae bacterium]
MTPRSVVVVGAGLAGARCAETLRAEGFEGRVVLVGEEPTAPYERPALSKEFLAGERERVELRPPGFWEEHGIELVLGRRIESVDLLHRSAGEGLEWDALVIATGARARRLPLAAPAGVHSLRTVGDAAALRGRLGPGRRLVIVGAGFVGAEVASTAAALGTEVTVLDVARVPLERVLGAEVGAVLAERYGAHGVDLRPETGLAGFVAGAAGRLEAVELAGGSRLPCDCALVAVGAEPAVELLVGDRGGIPTDACGRTAIPGVYACGDVASSWRPSAGRRLRVEHWTSAAGQAAAVARAILGYERPYDDLPYFWSDQFGLRLQHVGHADEWASVELEGEPGSFTARYLDRDGRLLAALLANRPREVAAARRELAAAHAA